MKANFIAIIKVIQQRRQSLFDVGSGPAENVRSWGHVPESILKEAAGTIVPGKCVDKFLILFLTQKQI
jgi:hypothetical protein